MQVTIIGSGNVATVMGNQLLRYGHTVCEVYSRDPAHARELAQQLNAKAVAESAQLDKNADLYIIAVSDDALPLVASELSLGDKLVVHTAGSISKNVLAKTSTNHGVFWPMKMIRKSMTSIHPATIVVDGNTGSAIKRLTELAEQFSTRVVVADDEKRAKMHMIAAVASNFTNHIYHLAADYCAAEQIDFALFYPIIMETAQAIDGNYPGDVQAGPAFRGDGQTIDKHVQLLAKYPRLLEIYRQLSRSIRETFSRGQESNP